MVVAAGAAHAHRQKDVAGDVGHFIEDFGPRPIDVGDVVFVWGLSQEPGGGDGIGIVRRDLVAGELLTDEPVVGHVGVEGPHHVVAVPPGRGPEGVLPESVALGIPAEIEPVPGHAFAIAWIAEQPIHQPLIGIGGGIVDERFDVGGGGRHSEQIEREPPNERTTVGLGNGFEARLAELGENELIDRVVDDRSRQPDGERVSRWQRWRRGSHDRAECPIAAVLGGDASLLGSLLRAGGCCLHVVHFRQACGEQFRGWLRAGPGGAVFHPGDDRLDLDVGQFAIRGHLPRLVADSGHEVARIGIVEIDCRTRLASAEQADQTIEPQPSLLFFGAVAADAPLDEHRADLRLEEGDPISGRLSSQPCARTSRDQRGGQQTVEVVPDHDQSFKP